MNITELARILKIPTQELRDKLPLLGFDIGQKAIKVDNKTARKIIKEWPILIKQLKAQEQKEQEIKQETDTAESQDKKEIKIPSSITVRNFAQIANLPINVVLSELMKNSIFISLNEKIDFETAAIIGSDLGLEIKLDKKQAEQTENQADEAEDLLNQKSSSNLQPRPPVIVVMGHVDHGKTKLLDAIRKTNVVEGEAGGITQHIGAYQVIHKNKTITFIDTPGHKAFTAMRGRGAKIADIAILVIAADDGIKPQTIEAYRIIAAAKLPFIVAINKIDKAEADIKKTKQELTNQLKIVPEDWGGDTVCAEVSAKKNQGIEDLLNMVLLIAEMEAENIKANPDIAAQGTIIESHIDKGEGPVATILVQNGILKVGDQLCFENKLYGKVRALKNYLGKSAEQATPAMPVKIIGLKITPEVGDIIQVGSGKKIKTKNIKSNLSKLITEQTESQEDEDKNKHKEINLIVKSDVLGSGEAIEESLAKIETEEVKNNIINKGLGNITEGDVARAEASKAQIIGFNVKITPPVQELARRKNVTIKLYKIIYELIDDIKAQIQELIEPEIKRIELGKLKVLAIFKDENNGQVIGGKVTQGKVEANCLIEVLRDREMIAQGKLTKLQSAKQDVDLVEEDQECGIQYEGSPVIKEGDSLRFYKEEKIVKKI